MNPSEEETELRTVDFMGDECFAYCVMFLKNSGERIRAIYLAKKALGIDFNAARAWVDALKMDRIKTEPTEGQKKTFAEYPTHPIPEELEVRIMLKANHWPHPRRA